MSNDFIISYNISASKKDNSIFDSIFNFLEKMVK